MSRRANNLRRMQEAKNQRRRLRETERRDQTMKQIREDATVSEKNPSNKESTNANDTELSDAFLDSLLDKDAFGRYLTGVVSKVAPNRSPEYDPAEFAIRMPNSGILKLVSFYSDYTLVYHCDRKGCLADVRKGIAEMLRDGPTVESYDVAVHRLYPMAAPRASIETGNLLAVAERPQDRTPYAAASEHIAIRLVVDRPHTFLYVKEKELRGWGVTFEAALEAATRNLRSSNRSVWRELQQGTYIANESLGDYASALLVQPELFHGLRVDGDLVVLAGLMNVIVATGSCDRGGLAYMARLAIDMTKYQRQVWLAPLLLKDGKWVPFIASLDPGTQATFDSLESAAVDREYDQQTAALQQGRLCYEFPASRFRHVHRTTGEAMTVTTWAKQGSPVILPAADVVGLVDIDPETNVLKQPMTHVRWDCLLSMVRNPPRRMTDYFPVRYLATDFPSDEEMSRLRAEGTADVGI